MSLILIRLSEIAVRPYLSVSLRMRKLGVVAGLIVLCPIEVPADTACSELLQAPGFLEIPDAPTTLVSAAVVPAKDGLPEHCEVRGYVAPQVNFELRLPITAWNGKFLMQGCGGLCGGINSAACDDVLARNYSVVMTDMGHQAPSFQALWAYRNLPAEIDFAYRATHVVAVAAKVIVDAFYGTLPRWSYFRGCSTGGRQGLIEAQRFPADFDGIISGAPVLNETGIAALHLIWSGRANLDDARVPILSVEQVAAVHQSVIAACDSSDGLTDDIIEDPRRCDWEAAVPKCSGSDAGVDCLSVAAIDTLRKLYGGAQNSAGEFLSPGGLMPGSEYEWVPYFVGQDGPATFHPDGPIKQLYQNLLFFVDPGPGHSAWEFDFDRDPPRLELMERLYSALNPDLQKFKARGGKLIIYQGWDDAEVPPMHTINYFETVQATMGGSIATAEFLRLFMLSGMAHCRRGPGADTIDWLTYLEQWVESDRPPASVIAYHQTTPQDYLGLPRPRFPLTRDAFDWARPVYPYPDVARFTGKGDLNEPSNWRMK